MTRPSRVPPRKSGRAPKLEAAPIEPLEPLTLQALKAAVYIQNDQGPRATGKSKARHLSNAAADLELALILKKPKELTDRLCLDVAATALRILEQGD